MSAIEKAKQRIKSIPKDYRYDELKKLLEKLGFEEKNKGKTSGSRVAFYRPADKRIILLHKPHPTDIMSVASVRDVVNTLEKTNDL